MTFRLASGKVVPRRGRAMSSMNEGHPFSMHSILPWPAPRENGVQRRQQEPLQPVYTREGRAPWFAEPEATIPSPEPRLRVKSSCHLRWPKGKPSHSPSGHGGEGEGEPRGHLGGRGAMEGEKRELRGIWGEKEPSWQKGLQTGGLRWLLLLK